MIEVAHSFSRILCNLIISNSSFLLSLQALFYANKAFVVRKKAHDDNFTSVEGLDKVKTMQDKSVATSAWSDYDRHSSGQAYLITPWNVLRCFLESLLQVGCSNLALNGFLVLKFSFKWFRYMFFSCQILIKCLAKVIQVSTILEIVGDGVEAQLKSHYGKSLSDSKGLPIFSVSFSNLLGMQFFFCSFLFL